MPVLFRIVTANSESSVSIDVLRADYTFYEKKPNGRRFSINWLLRDYDGDISDLISLGEQVVHISCIPPLTYTKEIRPYTDVLFEEGEMTLAIPDRQILGGEKQAFGLGRVVGLAIVTEDSEFQVWTS